MTRFIISGIPGKASGEDISTALELSPGDCIFVDTYDPARAVGSHWPSCRSNAQPCNRPEHKCPGKGSS